MRILITGSRDWDDDVTIREAVSQAVAEAPPQGEYIVVHGGARGADRMAGLWAAHFGLQEEVHPADWGKYGKSAGFRRNAEMVNLGADVCLAFIKNNSRGASMTASLAEKAGIRTIRYTA